MKILDSEAVKQRKSILSDREEKRRYHIDSQNIASNLMNQINRWKEPEATQNALTSNSPSILIMSSGKRDKLLANYDVISGKHSHLVSRRKLKQAYSHLSKSYELIIPRDV